MRKAREVFIISLFLLILNSPVSFAQKFGTVLSDSSKISLLTCSPGDELYSVFGHSAVRVTDPVNKIDVVFNYGTFDFSDPNFYTNFVKGRLNYILSLSYYNRFKVEYDMEERWIYEQELRINKTQRQFLFDSLLTNYQPENRYYLYDFFFDNCATRIRDIFVESFPNQVSFDYTSLEQGKTFRELLQPYLVEKPWARFGIDLALGVLADRTAEPWDYMFLPDHMLTVFEHATLNSDSTLHPFTLPTETLLSGKVRNEKEAFNQPLFLFLIVLLIGIVLSFFDYRKKKLSRWFDTIILLLTGILGVVIVFLWFFADHSVTPWNLNVLWANPLYLLAIPLLLVNRMARLASWYFMGNFILLILVIVTWFFNPQQLPVEAFPITLLLAIRFGLVAYYKNRSLK